MTIKQLSDGNSGGNTVGQSASDLIGLHGVAVAQASSITCLGATCVVGHSTANFGFKSSNTGNAMIARVNSIIKVLKDKGIMAAT